jgi:peptidoglycan/LPS O-acetylase OafA/YrhL
MSLRPECCVAPAQTLEATKTERMPDLDGLRALAILLVLTCHFVSPCFPSEIIRRTTSFGWCGVDLFFVLSGFLIGGILLDHRDSANYYSVFYVRRFLRIIPLYLLVLLPLVLITAFGLQRHFGSHGLGDAGWGTVLIYLTFQQNAMQAISRVPGYLGPAWSLAIEEQFYLLLPPFVRNVRRRALVRLLIIAVLLAPMARVACWLFVQDLSKGAGLARLLLPCRWDALLPGVLIACGMRDEHFCAMVTARRALVQAAWVVLLAGLCAFAAWDTELISAFGQITGYTWIAAFFACTLLLSRSNERGILRQLLSRPIWKPLATISYGLYLLQGPTMAVREAVLERLGYPHVSWRATGIYALFLGLTFLLAFVSWQYFEKPILNLSHRHKFD